ncbi:biotin transporter BioY [Chitinasiproducens palmae]|uniref:Biotin transporter n=1 Tax=Chitinasiproducens palmae TaxID=1770053 RepID=A0A1H2PQM7_9BURK|nr:biotin transporter BioY [Chitinasiproducens palmae]SDV48306.1 biotin transport system substrate-specific component [Chitinasiproducens palmae]
MTSAVSTRSLSFVALFAALMAVFGLIPKVDLPFGVPITIQSLGVMLAGCLLGPRRGFQALLLFLLAVALGLPLLSGGRGGLGAFMAPSAGFLPGWAFGALATGLAMRVLPGSGPRGMAVRAFLASVIGGIGVVYLFGVLGLAWLAHMTVGQAFVACMAFIPGDAIKCVVCAMIVHTVARGMPDWDFDAPR